MQCFSVLRVPGYRLYATIMCEYYQLDVELVFVVYQSTNRILSCVNFDDSIINVFNEINQTYAYCVNEYL